MATSRRRVVSEPSRPALHIVEAPVEEASPVTPVDRAEELVDRWTGLLAGWSRKVGQSVMKAGSRVKEEVEDVWAEAKSVSRPKA